MHCQLVFKCLIYRDERGTERKVRGETNYVVEWDVFLVQSWTCVSYSIEEKEEKKKNLVSYQSLCIGYSCRVGGEGRWMAL